MLTSAEKVDVRRFCGFPAYANFGWVYDAQYGILETRMGGMSADEEAIIRTNFLPNLKTLEAAIPAVSGNLDTDKAAVWERNRTELADRKTLYNGMRRELCAFIGVRPGKGLGSGGSVTRT